MMVVKIKITAKVGVAGLPRLNSGSGWSKSSRKRKMNAMLVILLLSCFFPFIFCQCTNIFTVTVGDSSNGGDDSGDQASSGCVDVWKGRGSGGILIQRCVQLGEFMTNINAAGPLSVCNLELYFTEGQYVLSNITSQDIAVNVSLKMEAIDPNVNLTCSEKNRVSTTFTLTTISINLANAAGLPSGSFVLKGINFIDCVYSMRIDYVEDVLIDSCVIRGIKTSGLDMHNCLNITVLNTSFIDNEVLTFNSPFRGGAAGLSIAYSFQQKPQADPYLTIKGCEFTHNYANVDSSLNDQIDKALNENTFPARGAALSMIIVEHFAHITALVDSCEFNGNFAEAFGGALYIIISGDGTNHSMTFSNSVFRDNLCHGGGGAVFIGFLSTSLLRDPTSIEFDKCQFNNNTALSSGGVLIIRTQGEKSGNYGYVAFRSSNFSSNVGIGEGAAIVFGSLQKVLTRRLFTSSIMEDCIFFNNTSDGGVVIVGFTNIESLGTCQFIENDGPALRVTGAELKLKGNLSFIGNKADVSGKAALFLTALGQVKIYKGSYISFINNQGSIGAAVRVESQTFPQSYLDTVDNPLCFLQYEDSTVPPSQWDEGRIYFSGNTANLGSAIFASSFSFCSYDAVIDGNEITKIFDVKHVTEWPIFNFSTNYNQYHSGKEDDRTFYIQTPAVSVEDGDRYKKISLRPNVEKSFNLTGLDEFGNPTFYIARILDRNNSFSFRLIDTFNNITESFEPPANYSILYQEKDIPLLRFNPNLLAIYPGVSIVTEYAIGFGDSVVSDVADQKEVLIEVQDSYGVQYDTVQVEITAASCLPGYELRPSQANPRIHTCECIGAIKDDFAVLECDRKENSIVLRNDYWSGRSTGNERGTNDEYLAVSTCPVTYCQCIDDNITGSCVAIYYYDNINSQCHPPREGPLCGVCGNGTVITVTRFTCYDSCVIPEYATYIATALLVIIDSIVIVVVLLVFIKTEVALPNKLKSMLFYVQTVYITTEYFPISFWDSRQYMLYFGNLLSLFFLFDFCFIPDAPSVLSFSLRFIPAVLAIIIVAIFCIFRRARRKIWHGVWTLILLLYPSLVYTCMMLLNCHTLPDTNGEKDVQRWFLDASITCFDNSAHSVLATIAILFMIVLVGLIPLMAALLLFENTAFVQERFPALLHPIEVLKMSYRPNLQWMSVVELIKRLILLGVAVGAPGRTVAPIYVLSFILALSLYTLPYTGITDNIFELIILVNYVVLIMLRYCQTILDELATYTGVMVPSSNQNLLPQDVRVIVFFSFFFYLPIIIAVCVFVAWVGLKLRNLYNEKHSDSLESAATKSDQKMNTLQRYRDFDKYFHRHNSNNVMSKAGKLIPITYIDSEGLNKRPLTREHSAIND